jgi:hypothetical protein
MQKLRERIRKFRERLIYCAEIESEIQHADFKKLKALRAKLSDEMEPIGIPTMMGLPVVFSIFFSVLSFAQPQVALWLAIFDWLQLPQHAFFVGICITALLFAGINAVVALMIGKGSMAAFKTHILLVGLTLIMSAVYLVNVLLGCVNDSVWVGAGPVTAILGIVFITFSIMIILSPAFYKMMVFYLHNRAFRKSLLLMRNMKGKRGQWREWNK